MQLLGLPLIPFSSASALVLMPLSIFVALVLNSMLFLGPILHDLIEANLITASTAEISLNAENSASLELAKSPAAFLAAVNFNKNHLIYRVKEVASVQLPQMLRELLPFFLSGE
jgi:hypothetical protein